MNFDNFVLLFCNGDPPSGERLRKLIPHPSLVACADGGALKAKSSGFEPDIIVGDLDSLNSAQPDFKNAEIVKIDTQENTDFEKTLNVLIERGERNILTVSFSGGRIDQTLANLQIAYEQSKRSTIILADEDYLLFPLTRILELDVSPGTDVSLIAMEDDTHVSTRGLAFELSDSHLRRGGHGISNRSIGGKVEITVNRGGIIAFVKHE